MKKTDSTRFRVAVTTVNAGNEVFVAVAVAVRACAGR